MLQNYVAKTLENQSSVGVSQVYLSTTNINLGQGAGVGQSYGAVAIGRYAGNISQGTNAVAIGLNTGLGTQGLQATALGNGAGYYAQRMNATAVGSCSGYYKQGSYSVAVGSDSGTTVQGGNSIAIGSSAGWRYQGGNSIAIGNHAGYDTIGGNSIAIGSYAGTTNQNDYSIVINATGADLNTSQNNSFYVAPIRTIGTGTASSLLTYNTTNKEIQYATSVTMAGSISASGYFSSSDARLKKDLQPFPSVLEHLRNIHPCRFTWKNNNKPDYGFIAQQFFDEFDFLKDEHNYTGPFPKDASGNDIYYTMEYAKLTPILCKAIQELDQKIEDLKYLLNIK